LAIESLRQKKLHEKALETSQLQLNTLLQILDKIEETSTTEQVVAALKDGNLALKTLVEKSGLVPEKVEDVMDELHELLETERSVEEALAEPLEAEDDEALEKEFAALEQEVALELQAAPSPPTELPTALEQQEEIQQQPQPVKPKVRVAEHAQ
jgi:hypothetical protein